MRYDKTAYAALWNQSSRGMLAQFKKPRGSSGRFKGDWLVKPITVRNYCQDELVRDGFSPAWN